MRTFNVIIVYAILIIVSFFHLIPSVWVILSSFKIGDSLYSSTLFPTQYTLVHYKELFTETDFLKWVGNTLYVAVTSTIIGTFLTVMTSFALSRYRFKGRKSYLNFILVVTMFPGMIGLLAVYIVFLNLGLLDNLNSLILVNSTTAITGWVLVTKGFFDNFPASLDESARIEGAGHLTIFFRIFIPLCKPIIVFISLMTFSAIFVEYVFPSVIITNPDKYLMSMGLYNMVNNEFGSTQYVLFATGSVLVALPITLIFLFLQPLLTQGLTAGANKE